jgi:hypothetical protein
MKGANIITRIYQRAKTLGKRKGSEGYEPLEGDPTNDEKLQKLDADDEESKETESIDEKSVSLEDGPEPKATPNAIALKGVNEAIEDEEEFFRKHKGKKKYKTFELGAKPKSADSDDQSDDGDDQLLELLTDEDEAEDVAIDKKYGGLKEQGQKYLDDQVKGKNKDVAIALDDLQQMAEEGFIDLEDDTAGGEIKAEEKKDIKNKLEGMKAKLSALKNALSSKKEDLFEYFEKSTALEDLALTIKDLLEAIHKLAEHASHLTEHASHLTAHASASSTVLPIVGAVPALIMMLHHTNQLRSTSTRIVKHDQLRKDIQKDSAQATLDASLKCVMDIEKQNAKFLIARISSDGLTAAGHLVTLGGVSGIVGLPMALAGVAGSMLSAVGAKGAEYWDARTGYKVERDQEMNPEPLEVIKTNPRKAVQIMINQARAGDKNAVQALRSFGIKANVIDGTGHPDKASQELGRAMRRKILEQKLNRADEDPKPVLHDMKDTYDGMKAYMSMTNKKDDLDDLKNAKNLLVQYGKGDRSTLWVAYKVIFTLDTQEQKRKMLEAVNLAVEDKQLTDDDKIKVVRELLKPRASI